MESKNEYLGTNIYLFIATATVPITDVLTVHYLMVFVSLALP